MEGLFTRVETIETDNTASTSSAKYIIFASIVALGLAAVLIVAKSAQDDTK